RGKSVATLSLCKSSNVPRLSGLAQIMWDNPELIDAYDALFGALRLVRPLASGNSILVTSAEPGDGKTTVSACLAIMASLAGQTALLIDGDLRGSSLISAVGRAGDEIGRGSCRD